MFTRKCDPSRGLAVSCFSHASVQQIHLFICNGFLVLLEKPDVELLALPSPEQSSFYVSCCIDWPGFVTPWTVSSTIGPVEVAGLPSNAAQCSIFLMQWEVYIHRIHALEHRLFRWEPSGLEEQFPWDRGDTQDSLAIKVRIAGRREMKQVHVHDLTCFTYKIPLDLAGHEWSTQLLVHHGGPGLHFDSRVQHLHMQRRSFHSRQAGEGDPPPNKRRTSTTAWKTKCVSPIPWTTSASTGQPTSWD